MYESKIFSNEKICLSCNKRANRLLFVLSILIDRTRPSYVFRCFSFSHNIFDTSSTIVDHQTRKEKKRNEKKRSSTREYVLTISKPMCYGYLSFRLNDSTLHSPFTLSLSLARALLFSYYSSQSVESIKQRLQSHSHILSSIEEKKSERTFQPINNENISFYARLLMWRPNNIVD